MRACVRCAWGNRAPPRAPGRPSRPAPPCPAPPCPAPHPRDWTADAAAQVEGAFGTIGGWTNAWNGMIADCIDLPVYVVLGIDYVSQ